MSQPTFDRIMAQLDRLGLWRIKETLADTLEIAQAESWGFAILLDRLLEDEIAAREERRIRNSLKLSGLPFVKTLDSFDFAFQPSLDRARLLDLASLAFLARKENILRCSALPALARPISPWLWPSVPARTAPPSTSPPSTR